MNPFVRHPEWFACQNTKVNRILKLVSPLTQYIILVIADLLIYLIDGKRSVCSCLPGCETDFVTITKSETTDWFLGTNIKWIVFEYPTVRYKRSLIFSFTNLLGKFWRFFKTMLYHNFENFSASRRSCGIVFGMQHFKYCRTDLLFDPTFLLGRLS